jgi:hypothetical protein
MKDTTQFGGFLFLLSLIGLCWTSVGFADDNHVHVEQVDSGEVDLNITQKGYDNKVDFSFAHTGNEFNFLQTGNGNTITWVSFWGSGKGWGGDVDGSNNTENVSQTGGATYGRHILGNSNTADIYQSGTHTHNLDIHVNSVDHDLHQSGSGTHYNQTYFYGSSDGSNTNIMQKGSGNMTSQITLTGSYATTLNLLQDSSTNQSYTLTQNCVTAGGCTVSMTQE